MPLALPLSCLPFAQTLPDRCLDQLLPPEADERRETLGPQKRRPAE
ncbi:unnamed protein product [Ectocarpus sp. CCAP 1310/34]|nr:unnamed protein product [Ectocarpus sp. CCAP 1310/34]